MIELKVLKTLVPQKARAWFVREGYILNLFTAIAKSFEEIRLWFEKLEQNAFPISVDETVAEWFDEYGMIYDSSIPISDQRKKLLSKVYQLGASDKEYIISLLRKAGINNVNIIEGITPEENECGNAECGDSECNGLFVEWGVYDDYWAHYLVYGTTETTDQMQTLMNILDQNVRVGLEPILYLNFWAIEDGTWDDAKFWIDSKIWQDTI